MWGKAYAQHGGQYSILTGDTSDWNFELAPSFWGGWYTSHVEVTYETDTNAELGVKTGATKTLKSEPQTFSMYPSIAATIIYIIILLVIIALIVLAIVKLKRRRSIALTWVEYTVKKTDDIHKLAKEYDVSWKLIARVNKLKAPYVLAYRDIIMLPPIKDSKPAKRTTVRKNSTKPTNRRGKKS